MDNAYVDEVVKVRDHCHIIGKYKGCVHPDCNVSLKLNHKIPAHNLNWLEKYMNFSIINKLGFIDSFQLSSS